MKKLWKYEMKKNIKNNKYFKKWKWFILLFIICAIIVSLLNYIFVHKAPEKELVKNFVLANTNIQSEFGEPLSIESIRSAKISYKQNKHEGNYAFNIKGSKKSGAIRIRWQSKGEGADFTVDSIELIENWKDPVVLWPPKE